MIYIEKDATPPLILVQNKNEWTKELKDNIKKYGGYENIPLDIKNSMWVHYRHKDIKEKLFACSYQKCAFCESKPAESGNIEVEHFKPKSLYPDFAFDCRSARKYADENKIADRTIEICDLNSERLYEVRAKLLKSLCSYEKQVKAWIKEISTADTDRKRTTRINILRDSLEILENLTVPEQPYAGFCRYFLNKSKVYKEAKKLIGERL